MHAWYSTPMVIIIKTLCKLEITFSLVFACVIGTPSKGHPRSRTILIKLSSHMSTFFALRVAVSFWFCFALNCWLVLGSGIIPKCVCVWTSMLWQVLNPCVICWHCDGTRKDLIAGLADSSPPLFCNHRLRIASSSIDFTGLVYVSVCGTRYSNAKFLFCSSVASRVSVRSVFQYIRRFGKG